MKNSKGFTLIELMIVIAIIGILAAVAIPNFIAYRNKTFCSSVESDAQNVASRIADYFAIPTHQVLPSEEDLGVHVWTNTVTINGNAAGTITITVTDSTERCPEDYRGANNDWTGFVYTKVIK
ncbi:MAG: prepilin-type N-terminal cleavage/methylation domain-containing protein [Desulfobacteraceae bacterium]|nr:MAG: prepilin-type N-terminal cleavage/methylation domain-containing protein [Desulfobacteraceae bacterium]